MRKPCAILGLLALTGCPAPTPAPVGDPTVATSPTATPVPVASVSPVATTTAAPTLAPTTAPTSFALTGLIYGEQAEPIEGVRISAKGTVGEPTSGTTGTDGRYTLTLAPGTYVVTAFKEGFTSRQQSVTVDKATALNFGQANLLERNPYWLSGTPEIESVTVEEKAPGGPLTLRLSVSEPLPELARQNISDAFVLQADQSNDFLETRRNSAFRIKPTFEWDAAGKVFSFSWPGPYLAGSATVDRQYTVRLAQARKTTKDANGDFEYEDLKIADAQGNKLGRGRMIEAFLTQPLALVALENLESSRFGIYSEERRWNVTHQGEFSFSAAKDTVAPKLLSVQVEKNVGLGSSNADIMVLKFSEPMRVAKDKLNPEYTRLEKDKKLVIVNVTSTVNGSDFRPLGSNVKVSQVVFDRDDSSVVNLYYPVDTFNNQERVEVFLDVDVRDPVDNKPDPAFSKAVGAII